MRRDRRFEIKRQHTLFDVTRASLSHHARELAGLRKTKSVRRIRIGWRRVDMLGHDVRHHVAERVDFALAPDRERHGAARLCNAQHLTQRRYGIGYEHHAESANSRVEGVVGKW